MNVTGWLKIEWVKVLNFGIIILSRGRFPYRRTRHLPRAPNFQGRHWVANFQQIFTLENFFFYYVSTANNYRGSKQEDIINCYGKIKYCVISCNFSPTTVPILL